MPETTGFLESHFPGNQEIVWKNRFQSYTQKGAGKKIKINKGK